MSIQFEWSNSIDDLATSDPQIAAILRPMRFLSDLLSHWTESGENIEDISFISQDEFTIDVVLPLPNSRWLVLDCT